MIYNVRHVSTLRYAAPVAQAQFNLRLVPWAWPGQELRDCVLRVTPLPGKRHDTAGPYCVNTTQIGFSVPFDKLEITSEFTMAINPPPAPPDGPKTAQVRAAAAIERDLSITSPVPYLFPSRIAGIDNAIGNWAENHLQTGASIVPSVSALMGAIHGEFTYSSGATTSRTPPEEAFARREGVCQDFAHIMIMALRSHGIPAAYGTARVNNGSSQVDLVIFAYEFSNNRAYHFAAITPAGNSGTFNSMYQSMRRISQSEADQVIPRVLDVVTVQRGDTVSSLARRMAYTDAQEERFRVLNGFGSSDQLMAGQKVKIVVRGR